MTKALEITLQIPMEKVDAEIDSTIECMIEDLKYSLREDYNVAILQDDVKRLGQLLGQYAATHKDVLITAFGDYLAEYHDELVEAIVESETFWNNDAITDEFLESFVQENESLINQMESNFEKSVGGQIVELQKQAKNLGYRLVRE